MSRRSFWSLAVLSTLALAVWCQPLSAQRRVRTASPLPPQVAEIDKFVEQGWKDFKITASPRATDGEWCRRVFLDVLGRIPTVEELDAFTKSREPDKRQKLINSLLEDDKYIEEYARNFTTLWTNILIGRSGGTGYRTMISRAGMQKYLRDSFARNKPYDRMVFELVTARGSNTPGADDFNGAVNFLIMKVNEEKAAQATADTSPRRPTSFASS